MAMLPAVIGCLEHIATVNRKFWQKSKLARSSFYLLSRRFFENFGIPMISFIRGLVRFFCFSIPTSLALDLGRDPPYPRIIEVRDVFVGRREYVPVWSQHLVLMLEHEEIQIPFAVVEGITSRLTGSTNFSIGNLLYRSWL
jgi:hypothetical protein